MPYLLTHYIKDTPGTSGWKNLGFIVYQGEKYFQSFSSYEFSSSKLEEMEEEGAIQKLDLPVYIEKGKSVWITPTGKIYIADEKNPFADLHKIEIANIAGPEIPTEDFILMQLNKLWNPSALSEHEKNPSTTETMIYLKNCPEWETVLTCLKIQISARTIEEIAQHSWIYELLFTYQNKYAKSFHSYCSYLQIKFDYSKCRFFIGKTVFELKTSGKAALKSLLIQSLN